MVTPPLVLERASPLAKTESPWRHVDQLVEVGRDLYDAMLALAVWVKNNPGQGSLYRSQHELIGAFRVGDMWMSWPNATLRSMASRQFSNPQAKPSKSWLDVGQARPPRV